MHHELVSKIWAYNPTNGEITRNGEPVRTLWYPDKNPDCGYRCQVNHDGMNYSYKAEHVAWCLLTGEDLPKNHKPQHINGDKRDNRARNLYLVIEAAKTNDPNYYTVVMADTSLARAIYPAGRKTGDTWTCDAPGTMPMYSDYRGKAHKYLERRGSYCLARGEPVPQWTDPVNLEHFEEWIYAHEAAERAYMAEIHRLLALGYTL
jgi:hypothetical protein